MKIMSLQPLDKDMCPIKAFPPKHPVCNRDEKQYRFSACYEIPASRKKKKVAAVHAIRVNTDGGFFTGTTGLKILYSGDMLTLTYDLVGAFPLDIINATEFCKWKNGL